MASRARKQDPEQPPRRRRSRYRVQAPLDVTVLRSGIPDTLPGRSVNLGEGGVAAVIAGELLPGEAVGVEIHLPTAAEPLRTRAMVKHHDRLRSGMEFLGLSLAQKAAIRAWVKEAKAELETGVPPGIAGAGTKDPQRKDLHRLDTRKQDRERQDWHESVTAGVQFAPPSSRRRLWVAVLAVLGILTAIGWWRWNRGWEELESGLRKNEQIVETTRPQARVPADVMEKLVIHRVDPDYPAAARSERLRGVIVLDVVVGRDGSVVEMHALNGPEILAQAAMSALRWWRFEPYRVDGQPVVVGTTVAVEFKP